MPVVKLKTKAQRALDDAYADFVDDLGGFLWHLRMATHKPFVALARDVGCSPGTLLRLANRVTKNPTTRTTWKILRGLDNRNIIRHSMLEQYRPLSKSAASVVRSIEKERKRA